MVYSVFDRCCDDCEPDFGASPALTSSNQIKAVFIEVLLAILPSLVVVNQLCVSCDQENLILKYSALPLPVSLQAAVWSF